MYFEGDDSEVAKDLRLYGELHRFIPAIANWSGARIHEMKVNHGLANLARVNTASAELYA